MFATIARVTILAGILATCFAGCRKQQPQAKTKADYEAEATRQTKGTGLGLALVNKFAHAHNGFVQILTAKPHGAIFRVGLAVQS